MQLVAKSGWCRQLSALCNHICLSPSPPVGMKHATAPLCLAGSSAHQQCWMNLASCHSDLYNMLHIDTCDIGWLMFRELVMLQAPVPQSNLDRIASE